MIDVNDSALSKRLQCELLGLNRSTLYYRARGPNEFTQSVMNIVDEIYTKHPFFGHRKMSAIVNKLGYQVGRKGMRTIYQLLGLEAIYPKPKLSQSNKDHKKYPYLLRGLNIRRNNQVWSTDITYIRLKRGFIYLVAIIDWFSRYVLDWQISTSLEADFCIETLERSLAKNHCEIFNTDQGSQFTSNNFTKLILDRGIKLSMDGRGRALDNIFVERLWRSVKYECVYLNSFETVNDAMVKIKEYFEFYNHERPHQSLLYKTPAEVYFQ